MPLVRTAYHTLRRIVLGATDLPQQCTVGLRDPQLEVSVWLHGWDAPLDVTDCHVLAAAAPFTIGIGFTERRRPADRRARLSLKFQERAKYQRLLGEIGLRPFDVISIGNQELHLFEARTCRNYCIPKPRLWAHYLHKAYA